jgi:hypothetical protein
MAVDDVISDWEVAWAATTTVSIQPASGVEWLLTEIFTTEGATNEGLIYPTTTDSPLTSFVPGATSFGPNQDLAVITGLASRRWFVTNAQYPRLRNAGGEVNAFAYNGLQTK